MSTPPQLATPVSRLHVHLDVPMLELTTSSGLDTQLATPVSRLHVHLDVPMLQLTTSSGLHTQLATPVSRLHVHLDVPMLQLTTSSVELWLVILTLEMEAGRPMYRMLMKV